MTPRGKLIAIEGIDGSGKRTQLDLLAQALGSRGLSTLLVSFPRYESFFGKLVARFLNGEFGSVDQVDPHLSALLYAGDRLEAKPEIVAALATGKIVLADRYIASNLAHQSERVPPERREEYLAWLKELEYRLYGLPEEDLVLYLQVPAPEAHRLVGLKSVRSYTKRRRDILEADISHLEQTALTYERLATAPNWVCINCIDPGSGALRSPEEIHREVLRVVDARILSQAFHG
ncbi:MAG: thymidylate kinase [Candidatus Acidiferrales bacterium]